MTYLVVGITFNLVPHVWKNRQRNQVLAALRIDLLLGFGDSPQNVCSMSIKTPKLFVPVEKGLNGLLATKSHLAAPFICLLP